MLVHDHSSIQSVIFLDSFVYFLDLYTLHYLNLNFFYFKRFIEARFKLRLFPFQSELDLFHIILI